MTDREKPENEKPKGGGRRELEGHASVWRWLEGLEDSTKPGYLSSLRKFVAFAKKDPDTMVTERRADLDLPDTDLQRFRYEDLYMAFFRDIEKKMRGQSTETHARRIKSFFDTNRVGLELTRSQRKEITRSAAPFYIDYVPTREDLVRMAEAANVRDRAILLTMASSPLSGDLCELTKEQFEAANKVHADRVAKGEFAKDDPMCLAPGRLFLLRKKTRVKMRPFLTPDAAHAIRAWLKSRRDDLSWLFVSEGRRQLQEQDLNRIVQKLARAAGLQIPKGQRLIAHGSFRKMFNDVGNYVGVPRDWICVLYGHKISGTEDFYTPANEDKLREKYKKMAPHLSVSRAQNMVILRNQFGAALDDLTEAHVELLRRFVGDKAFREKAAAVLAIVSSVSWDPEKEFEPAIFRVQRALRKVLGEETS